MDYIELKCSLNTKTEEAKEVLIAELSQLGYNSFQECEDCLLAYIPSNQFKEDLYNDIYCVKEKYFGEIKFSFQFYKDKNWNEYWEKNFEPVVVNELLLIRAPFHKIKKQYRYEIVLEPKMSFGTGHHATTWLMLSAMLNIEINDKDILDIGCGTGILSVFASMKGAKNVIGFDNNDWAYSNAIENIQLNNSKNVKILSGDINSISISRDFDIILANINRNVILQEMTEYLKYLKNDGMILFSGLLKENYSEIQKEAEKNELVLIEKIEKENWLLLKYYRELIKN